MYAKVFRSLFYGSLTGQADPQHVLICLLTHADRDGHVELPPAAVAALTGIPLERVQAAIAVLEAPDPDSRSPELDGRRLEVIGSSRWQIVNHAKYRGMRDEDSRREQTRKAVERHRVSRGKPDVSPRKPLKAHTEADTETEADSDADESKPLSAAADVRSRNREKEPRGFAEFYAAYPRHDGRRAAALEFARALNRHPTYSASDLKDGAAQFAAQVASEQRDRQFIPMPKVWLHQDRFREFFDEDDDDAQTQEPAEAECP